MLATSQLMHSLPSSYSSPSLKRLSQGCVNRDDDVAKHARWVSGRYVVRVHRKRQHVGGLVLLPPLGVELTDVGVIAEDNRQLCWAWATSHSTSKHVQIT